MKLFYSLFILLTCHFSTQACSCFFSPMSVKHLNEIPFAFKGEIIKKVTVDKKGGTEVVGDIEEHAINYFKYTFRIDKVIKGKVISETVDIYSATQGSMCGVNYAVGSRMLLYVGNSDGYYSTGSCSQNIRLSKLNRAYKKILRRFKWGKRVKRWKNVKGLVIAEGKVVKKMAQGNWTYYHEDGSVQSKGNYLNGQPHGVWNYYLSIEDSKNHLAALPKDEQSKYTKGEPFLQRWVTYEKGEVVDQKYFQ